MNIRDLQQALKDVGSLLGASGASKPASDVDDFAKLLDGKADQDLAKVLDQLKAELLPVELTVKALQAAGTDEAAFLVVLRQLESRKLAKSEIQAIARGYTGTADKAASANKLLKAISTHFYGLAYERESRAMAKVATPV